MSNPSLSDDLVPDWAGIALHLFKKDTASAQSGADRSAGTNLPDGDLGHSLPASPDGVGAV